MLIIPNILFTCWHSDNLPPLMRKNLEENIKKNIEIDFHFYNEKKCKNFIKKNFNKNVYRAYNQLVPCSYKSDLWRFCALYLFGGIYLDIKYSCVNNFKLKEILNKEHFVEESEYWKRENQRVYTGLICVEPGNTIMNNCIEKIVKNVEANYYGKCSLDPTGPGVLGGYVPQENKNHLILRFKDDKIFLGERLVLNYYDEYRIEQKKYQKLPHYAILWQQKKIYRKNKIL
jgi:mannosyltransferase OCH1-like enzyme